MTIVDMEEIRGRRLVVVEDFLWSLFSHVSEQLFGVVIYDDGVEQPRLCEDSSCRFSVSCL